MVGLELVVLLGVAVLVSSVLGRRLRIAPPLLLLASGVLLGFIPALRDIHLPGEVVLLLFLPALLYWESLTTSLREIRANLRGIILMSTGLVVATAGAVAATAHALGMPWGPAWVLGAAVAPTDATAVGVFARSLTRRPTTVLRAESLINDGTALVIYGVAVGVTMGDVELTALTVSGLLALAYVGGVLAGIVTAWLAIQVRRRLDDRMLENVVSVLTPFSAFLLAELVHASGVLAVVVCGLILSQAGPRLVRADTRQQSQAFWSLSTFLLNGSLFVLVGLELQSAVRGVTAGDLIDALIAVGLVTAVVVAVRFAFLFGTTYLIRLIDRRPQQRLRRVSNRSRVVSGLAGFRGAVSLAAALAIPAVDEQGLPFPQRNLIIFIVSGVIVVTLVVQGLLLRRVVTWARLPRDTSVDEEREFAERRATEEALAAIPEVASGLGIDSEVVDRLRQEYEEHLRVLQARGDDVDDEQALRQDEQYTALRLALLGRKRATIVRLRDERRIDDTVLRQVQSKLDIEEVRLSRRDIDE
ncbi:Na+/H+ antiporter [Salinibacterium sp. ZJ450]|uniref:Na+/H+ antiporter n=1 Tax=Salinibacterium sp. ZJ450 TaxID=2708338 RepID=UPI001424510E|nr:Na+/H+ antiporter [Salinibacterium sp. ZJ450]